jgi:ribonuclease D
MRLALLQVNDGEEIYLIDAVSISDPKDSCDFLISNSVKKIFHSCKEDLEAIHSWTGNIMGNLFDTQLANAFLDGHYSIGYQGLVEERLDITLDKKETRSNWIRRPLSDSQLSYAASDVEYLIHLFIEQEQALIESNKLDWHDEDLGVLISTTFNPLANIEEIGCNLTKSEERNLLNTFNDIVLNIAEREQINPTLFFSKKSQKGFIRLALNEGPEKALKDITSWRRGLIKESLNKLFLNY